MHELFTNAPAHWPRVCLEGLIKSSAPEVKAANRLIFATTVETLFRKSGIQVLEADVLRLTREGVLEIPLRVRADGVWRSRWARARRNSLAGAGR